jgi:hypothetical protein
MASCFYLIIPLVGSTNLEGTKITPGSSIFCGGFNAETRFIFIDERFAFTGSTVLISLSYKQ